jgi:hypothetical protein
MHPRHFQGSWAKVISNYGNLKSLPNEEINPGYLDIISMHPDIAEIQHNPKAHICIDDG